MTDKADEARRAAVLASKERKAAEALAKQEREAAKQAKAKVLEQNRQQWPSVVYDVIHRGVMASSDGFARHGSDYVILPRPKPGRDNDAIYQIHPSGNPTKIVATLTFAMDADADGTVRMRTSVGGCVLPASVRLADVTSEWAERATDAVLDAVLRNNP
jgi:hypothetical protein